MLEFSTLKRCLGGVQALMLATGQICHDAEAKPVSEFQAGSVSRPRGNRSAMVAVDWVLPGEANSTEGVQCALCCRDGDVAGTNLGGEREVLRFASLRVDVTSCEIK